MQDAGKVKQLTAMLSKKGMSAEQMVRALCQSKGIDVDDLMRLLKS